MSANSDTNPGEMVVTNPPFSLFREYIAQLMEYNKKFIVIGNLNAVKYKELFPYMKEDKLWLGATMFNGGAAYFVGKKDLFDPEKISNAKHAYIKDDKLYWRVNGVRWFTNVEHKKRNTPIDLYKKYSNEYPHYNNMDVIEVGKCENIPMDYDGIMGVPISFFDKYCPEQFEIIGCAAANVLPEGWKGMSQEFVDLYYKQGNTGQYQAGNRLENYVWNGKAVTPYARILIRKRNA